MQAIILAILMGGRTWCAAFFVGSMLLAGNAMADASKKGVPTKLVPIPTVVPQKTPPVTTVVLAPPKPAPECEWVPQTVVTQTPGHSVFLSGVTAGVCGCCGSGFVSAPAIFATAPGSETVNISYIKVCKQP